MKAVKLPLQDDKAEYDANLPIDTYMLLGKWTLSTVTLGSFEQKPINFNSPISFTVVPYPLKVRIEIDAPDAVKAGSSINFRATIYDVPNLPQCNYSLSARVTRNNGLPDWWSIGSRIPLKPGTQTIDQQTTRAFFTDTPKSQWILELSAAHVGGDTCPVPRLTTVSKPIAVLPNPDVVTPVSVALTVNPSQIEVLQAAYRESKKELFELLKLERGKGQTLSDETVSRRASAALQQLRDTQTAIDKAAGDPSSFKPASKDFFDDLRTEYPSIVPTNRAGDLRTGAHLVRVSQQSSNTGFGVLVNGLKRTIAAYSSVANSGYMTFDVPVSSIPSGGIISYKRRGDPEYRFISNETNFTLNLVRAVWFVRVQKDGCQDEKRVDGVDEKNPALKLTLRKNGVPCK